MAYSSPQKAHTPVLLDSVLSCLQPRSDGVYIDATFGAGGYSSAILNSAKCTVYGIDRDQSVVQYAQQLTKEFGSRIHLIHGEFAQLKALAEANDIPEVDGIVFDIGVSSMQLADADRGFSFMHDGPLDMRMDQSKGFSAQYVVNNYTEEQLANLIFHYGGEKKSRRIAKSIVASRKCQSIESTGQLSALIKDVVARYADSIHPATRTFQALRIEVNGELQQLEQGLKAASTLLKPNGLLIVVTFHSAEDVIVKQYFRELCGPTVKVNKYHNATEQSLQRSFIYINKKVIVPTQAEIRQNPRARSAKLRAIKRVKI